MNQSLIILTNALITDIIRLNPNAHRNPSISNPGTIHAVNIINNAFITNANSPNVINVMGNARSFTIGFINEFIMLITIIAITALV